MDWLELDTIPHTYFADLCQSLRRFFCSSKPILHLLPHLHLLPLDLLFLRAEQSQRRSRKLLLLILPRRTPNRLLHSLLHLRLLRLPALFLRRHAFSLANDDDDDDDDDSLSLLGGYTQSGARLLRKVCYPSLPYPLLYLITSQQTSQSIWVWPNSALCCFCCEIWNQNALIFTQTPRWLDLNLQIVFGNL